MNSSIPFETEGVWGYLHKADSAVDGMVLTHGVAGNCNAPSGRRGSLPGLRA